MLNRESCYHFRGDQNPPHDAHGSPMIREAFAWALTSLLPHFHQPAALSCLVSRDSPLPSCPQSQPQSFSGSWVTRMDLGGQGAGPGLAQGNKAFLFSSCTAPWGLMWVAVGRTPCTPHTDPSQGLAHSKCSPNSSHRIAGFIWFLHYQLNTDTEGLLSKDWKTSLGFHSQARVILDTQPGRWGLQGSEQYTKPEFRRAEQTF